MNCDRIARPYRWIEYAAFGRRLERHRFHYLAETRKSRNALLLGDGDGRFLAALARSNSRVEVDSLESSAGMIQVAKGRLRMAQVERPARIRFIQADALSADFPAGHYDLIVANFFLDCFSTSQTLQLIGAVSAACRPGAHWIITDFQRPSSGWRALYADIWLKAMYVFFRAATGLQTTRLPHYSDGLESVGFIRQSRFQSMADVVYSELWALAERRG